MTGSAGAAPLLRLSGIGRRFPGVVALDDVSMEIRAGEVHGLLGENGAGKSTLLKIVAGAQAPDAGRIEWQGKAVTLASPLAAQRLGIVTIYQEYNLVPQLSIAENVLIGRERRRGPLIDWPAMRREAAAAIGRIGLPLDPARRVAELSVAEQQMVEIARALSMESRLIVMDEPTAALSEPEVRRLLRIMRDLRAHGVSVIFVTHRLEEAREICDRVTVLRDGRGVGTRDVRDTGIDDMIRLMVGRTGESLYRRPAGRRVTGPVRLAVRGLVRRARGQRAAPPPPLDLEVRQGEIVGLAGLVGAGRTELARAIFGADPVLAGRIEIDGGPVSIRSPRQAIRAGIGLVPEDRKQQALFLSQAVRTNFSIAALARFLRLGVFVSERAEARELDRFRRSLRIRMRDGSQGVRDLSGGNQQKIVLARWLALQPRVLIVDEPTRGVDIAAKADVHELLHEMAASGIAILVISSELNEILAVSDRIVTMREGRVTGALPAAEATQPGLLALMALDQARAA